MLIEIHDVISGLTRTIADKKQINYRKIIDCR